MLDNSAKGLAVERVRVFDPEDKGGFLLADRIRAILTKDGSVKVNSVTRFRDLLESAEQIDLLLLPDLPRGITLGEAIKLVREESSTYIPMAVYTASSAEATRIQALRAGADYILQLPVDTVELQEVVKMLLRSRKRSLGFKEIVGDKDADNTATTEDAAEDAALESTGPTSTYVAATDTNYPDTNQPSTNYSDTNYKAENVYVSTRSGGAA